MKNQKGSILIFALMLVILTSLIGLSLVALKRGHYSAAQVALRATQAKYCAHSGIHDAVAKLARDPFFPSGLGDNHTMFTYKERLDESTTGEFLGYYEVTVDQSLRESEGIVVIKSVGSYQKGGQTPARHTSTAELRLDTDVFQLFSWQEG